MRPLIGVSPSISNDGNVHFIYPDHLKAIKQAGGTPFILSYGEEKDGEEKDILLQIAEGIDGLYVTGGNDIDPLIFGEEPHPNLGEVNPVRDYYELTLIQKVLDMNKPILGSCKGCQMINIALGGDMYQDIYTQINKPMLQHHQHAPPEHGSHVVEVLEGSLLRSIVKKAQIKVNSRHHQANRKAGHGMMHSGYASDGVVEASESTRHPFVLGVQWHPENMAVCGNEEARQLFARFIQACQSQ